MKYITLLPFMDTKEIKDLAHKVLNGEVKGVKLVTLFPFLDNETLEEIVDILVEKGEGKQLVTILPFVSKETVEKIYEGVKAGTITGVKEHYLVPFLGKKAIKEMFDDLIKKAHEEAVKNGEDEDEDEIEIEIEDE